MISFDEFDTEEYDIPNKEFSNFLLEHDAYHRFMINFKENKYDISSYIKLKSKCDYLMGAFKWTNSPEGFNYWSWLDDVWRSRAC